MQTRVSAGDAVGRPRKELLREVVYHAIRDRIVSGDLEPGQRLRDADLAGELEVSRTPVREALRRLEDEGLVETWANRWTRVTAIDLGEADRIYPVIWALERLAVTEAAAFGVDRIQALRVANEALQIAISDQDPVASSDADRRFHESLSGAWDNPEVTRILDELRLRLKRIEVHYFGDVSLAGERSISEHQAIIDALAKDDRTAAANAVEGNWRSSLGRLREGVGLR